MRGRQEVLIHFFLIKIILKGTWMRHDETGHVVQSQYVEHADDNVILDHHHSTFLLTLHTFFDC